MLFKGSLHITYPLVLQMIKNKELIKKNLAATRETGMKKDVNFLSDAEPPKKKTEAPKPKTRRDIMNKYL